MEKKKVILTGAAGKIGSIHWQAWEAEDRYALTLVDQVGIEDAKFRVEVGDLRDYTFSSRV
jgi:hypothetical protein